MRKYLCYLLITFCVMFLGMVNVSAATITRENNNVYTFTWENLSYDSNDYKLTCSNAQITGGDLSVKDHPSGSITFTPSIPSGTIECKIYKDDPSSGNPTLTSASITIGTTTTQAPATTTTTTTQARSNNNNLSSISLTTNEGEQVDLSPSFSPNVYTYSATVASTARTVSVDATMQDSRANLTISGADDELVAGENNRITITVTAEDGTPRTYTINVTREALTADATLKELSIKESKSFKLEENKYTYNVKIGKNVKTLTLDYTPSDENATVEVEGNENLKDGSKVRITVTAEDGTKRVYTLNIVKDVTTTKKNTSSVEVEKNPLIIMGLSVIAFGLIGGIIYVIRK